MESLIEQLNYLKGKVKEREDLEGKMKFLNKEIENLIFLMSREIFLEKNTTGDEILDYCILRSKIRWEYNPKAEEKLRDYQAKLKRDQFVLVVRKIKEHVGRREYFDTTDYYFGVLNGVNLVFHLPSDFSKLYELSCALPTERYAMHRSWKDQTGLVKDNLKLSLDDTVFFGDEIRGWLETEALGREKEIYQKLSQNLYEKGVKTHDKVLDEKIIFKARAK